MMGHVFIAEDEDASFRIVEFALMSDHYITRTKTVASSLEYLSKAVPDVIILDLMLPDGDGFPLLNYIKNHHHLKDKPCLFLSDHSQIENRVLGLQLGADDFLSKPVDPNELAARVANKIHRFSQFTENKRIDFFQLYIDTDCQKVKAMMDSVETEISLTPIEYKLLFYLGKNQNRVFAREELLINIWGGATNLSLRNIDTHINSIRKKLGDLALYVESVYGCGYRFNSEAIHQTQQAS